MEGTFRICVVPDEMTHEQLVDLARTFVDEEFTTYAEEHATEWESAGGRHRLIITRTVAPSDYTGFVHQDGNGADGYQCWAQGEPILTGKGLLSAEYHDHPPHRFGDRFTTRQCAVYRAHMMHALGGDSRRAFLAGVFHGGTHAQFLRTLADCLAEEARIHEGCARSVEQHITEHPNNKEEIKCQAS